MPPKVREWLETPEGWGRAQLLMSTLREPPKFGSVRETVLIMFTLMQERGNHARLRALVQSIVDKEKGVEAFEDYMKVAFPWIETAKGRERLDHMKKLMNEVKRGPLAVAPMAMPRVSSRLRTRIEKTAAPPPNPVAASRLLEKIERKAPR